MIGLLLNYLYNVMVTLSQAVNVILLFGDPDESVSGRIGKGLRRRAPWAAPFGWWPFARRHFLNSIEDDRGGNSTVGRKARP